MDYLSLCLICKDENDYLSEWLDYHILMGVDRFYIYDNESQVSLREALKDYVERGWVVVLDIPGRAMQLYAYDHCLQTFGANTFWMGFIDTDEFLVPKTAPDLKALLKGYEQYGGLAVSSLFFGSNGHQTRPIVGQIAAYTTRIHATFKDYALVKSIVQTKMALMPYSPHDFLYKDNYWCVNEGRLRVDNQDFPNHIEKIQLNHYFCRSTSEIDLKLRRGNSGMITWEQKRFAMVNSMANYEDTWIVQNLEKLFLEARGKLGDHEGTTGPGNLLKRMAVLARNKRPIPLEITPPVEMVFRHDIRTLLETAVQYKAITERGDRAEYKKWLLDQLQLFPQKISLLIDLAFCYLDDGTPMLAWQSLTEAWQLAPNSYSGLFGMTVYFLREKNFEMAEKSCHLLLEMAPHDLTVLGLMTETMLGLERWEEALKIGVPVVELAGLLGELPDRMGLNLVKKMADALRVKKDYAGAVHLWEAGVQSQPGDVNALVEFSQAMLLAGEKKKAGQHLAQAQALAPQNEAVLTLLKQIGGISHLRSTVVLLQKKRH